MGTHDLRPESALARSVPDLCRLLWPRKRLFAVQVVRDEYARLEAQTLDWHVELNWLLSHWRHIRSLGVFRSLVLAYRAEQVRLPCGSQDLLYLLEPG